MLESDEIVDDNANGSHHSSEGAFIATHRHRRHRATPLHSPTTTAALSALLASARADAERQTRHSRAHTVPLAVRMDPLASPADADSDFGPVVVVVDDTDCKRLNAAKRSFANVSKDNDAPSSPPWLAVPNDGPPASARAPIRVPSSSSSSSPSSTASPIKYAARNVATPYSAVLSQQLRGRVQRMSQSQTRPQSIVASMDNNGHLPFDSIGSQSPEKPVKHMMIQVDDDDSSDLRRRRIVDDDIEDVSDTLFEAKTMSRPVATDVPQQSTLRELFVADQTMDVSANHVDLAIKNRLMLAATPSSAVKPPRRTHVERVATARLCTDAKTVFWSYPSFDAVERLRVQPEAMLGWVESLGDRNRRRAATYVRFIDVLDARIVSVVARDTELSVEVAASTVCARLSVPLDADEAIRKRFEENCTAVANGATPARVSIRRVECDEAELSLSATVPQPTMHMYYSLRWSDHSTLTT